MKRLTTISLALLLGAALMFTPSPSLAQFGKLKDKAKKELEKKAEKEADKALSGEKSSENTEAESAEAQPAAENGENAPAEDTAARKDDFSLYTKFDFVPGNKVLYYDDLAGEEMAEFPSRWDLHEGVFEIARLGDSPWIMASTNGTIGPKLNLSELPDRYTIEYEFVNRNEMPHNLYFTTELQFLDSTGEKSAALNLTFNDRAYFYLRDAQGGFPNVADISLSRPFAKDIHNIRVMVTAKSIKMYVDEQRVVNSPRPDYFNPSSLRVQFHASDDDWIKQKMFIRNFRLAEGGKTMKEQLDETGKIITHGIYFDSGSDIIKGESYKTLADIGQLLTDSPALRVSIEGHTDSDGADDANQDLSKRRAEAVRTWLITTYKVDSGRLESNGWGEAKPVDTNDSAEGKANNRRVELVKL